MQFKNLQLELSEAETRRLGERVRYDYLNALSDHKRRMAKWTGFLRRWRARTDMPDIGDEDKSNYAEPVSKWSCFNQLAKEIESIFGEDAEVIAEPVGRMDYKRARKVGLYMSWRAFNDMKLLNPLVEFNLKKLIYGRAFGYCPWKREIARIKQGKRGKPKDTVIYEGPDFIPMDPDDLIVPAEDVRSLHEFSFVIRKYRARMQQLLVGERDGKYQGIQENWETLWAAAFKRNQREPDSDEVHYEQDDAEGVNKMGALSSPNTLLVLEWYGHWRMLLDPRKDADEFDFKARELDETELLVRFNPDTNQVIGVQALDDLYPSLEKKRPFVESCTIPDGSYWCSGLIEDICDIEDEIRSLQNKGTDALDRTIAPLILYRPGIGFETEHFKNEPGEMVPCEDPNGVKVITIEVPLQQIQGAKQELLADIERMHGQSDFSMGRTPDRPNTPQTATGTVQILQAGNVRVALDDKILAENMSNVFRHLWQLDCCFAPNELFFRVTDEDADGLFDVDQGGSLLTAEDRDGRFDFKIKFADSFWSKQAQKQETLSRYQIDLNNPLIVQNPAALWEVTRQVHQVLGDPDFAKIVPKPPAPDIPLDPKDEWIMIQQGEQVNVSPLDNDQLHMQRHMKDMQQAMADPQRDPEAFTNLKLHYLAHLQQLQQKTAVQAMAEEAVRRAGMLQQQLGPLGMVQGQAPPGMPAPPASPGQQQLATNFAPGQPGPPGGAIPGKGGPIPAAPAPAATQ